MVRPDPPDETWMDAHQYAELTEKQKKDVALAVETYEHEIAAAKKKMKDRIAEITS